MLEVTTKTAPSNWSAARTALVADALGSSCGSLNSMRLRVYGESMLPALWPGDVVEIESCSFEEIKPGDIVLAQREGRLFLHRLMSQPSTDGFCLRGDSMPASDPTFPAPALLGRLVQTGTRKRGVFGTALLSRAVGLLLCYSAVTRRAVLKLHHRRTTGRELILGSL